MMSPDTLRSKLRCAVGLSRDSRKTVYFTDDGDLD
jgi:hypothetical protein